jgi:hypothetical protein
MKTAIILKAGSDLFDPLVKTRQAKQEVRRLQIVGQQNAIWPFLGLSPTRG